MSVHCIVDFGKLYGSVENVCISESLIGRCPDRLRLTANSCKVTLKETHVIINIFGLIHRHSKFGLIHHHSEFGLIHYQSIGLIVHYPIAIQTDYQSYLSHIQAETLRIYLLLSFDKLPRQGCV